MRRESQCLLELCSAPVDLRGQASNLFIALLWVSEEMGLWLGARFVFALREDASSKARLSSSWSNSRQRRGQKAVDL